MSSMMSYRHWISLTSARKCRRQLHVQTSSVPTLTPACMSHVYEGQGGRKFMMKPSKDKNTVDKRSKQPIQKKKVKLKQKKSAFRSKLKTSHDAISQKKTQQQKKSKNKRKSRGSHSLNTMKSLVDTLEDFSAQYTGSRDLSMKIRRVTTSKQRESIMKEEKSRMSEVLHHPVFMANPLGAIMSHLEATLPPASHNSSMKE